MTLTLTAVLATHSWAWGNQLVRVCEYRAPREVSRWYNLYPARREVCWDCSCPKYIKVKKMK